MPRLLTGLSVVLVVLITACGGGDDDAPSSDDQLTQAQPAPIEAADDQETPADGATPEATEGEPRDAEPLGEYGTALLAIMDEVQLEIDVLDVQFQDAFSQEEITTAIFDRGLPAALSSVFDRLFASISEFSPQADRSISRGIAQIQALDPPGQFEADHELFVAGLIRDRELRRKVQGAADNGVAGILFAFVQESSDLKDELEAALSSEFLVFVEPFFDEDEDEDNEEGDEPDGETSDPFGEDGPDLTTVPDELTISGAIVEIAFNIPVNGGNSVFAVLLTDASSAEILDFYEAALPAFGIAGDVQRIDAEDFPALLIGRDERGGALLINDDDDPTSITLGYFVPE
jgi:hypothetical protein